MDLSDSEDEEESGVVGVDGGGGAGGGGGGAGGGGGGVSGGGGGDGKKEDGEMGRSSRGRGVGGELGVNKKGTPLYSRCGGWVAGLGEEVIRGRACF